MKVINVLDEAERLNLQKEATWDSFKQALKEKGSLPFFDYNNDEIIVTDSKEVKSLLDELHTSSVSLPEIAVRYSVTTPQMRLVINQLIRQEKLDGTVTASYEYLSKSVVRDRLVALISEMKMIEVNGQAFKLGLPVDVVNRQLFEFENGIVSASKPYSRIGIQDLSAEVGLPRDALFVVLKRLVSEGRIRGSIDMVNDLFVKDEAPVMAKQKVPFRAPEVAVSLPSGLWYLAPLFLGLIGGVIGYVSLVERDRDMAKSLFYIGLAVTLLSSFFYYLWFLSLTRIY